MQFVDFPQANHTFGKPSDMTDDQCGALRVYHRNVDIEGEKFPASTSAWKPSEEDLARLNAGGFIYLDIISSGHPPVAVYTGQPR